MKRSKHHQLPARLLGVLAVVALGLVLGAAPASASGPLNILTVGPNFGNRATETYVPTVGSPFGGVDHIGSTVSHVNEAGFNALTAAQLAAYDVVLTQWASSGVTDLGSTKVQNYVAGGGALFLDGDYNNYNDLGWVGITGAPSFCTGPWTFTAAADPVLTDSLPATPALANCHGHFPNFDPSVFVVFMTDALGQNAALAGRYGSGRIILTGPDQDYHAEPVHDAEQYQLLLNELEWTGGCDDSDPIAWWQFDEDSDQAGASGSVVLDSTANGNDGHLWNGASRVPGLSGTAALLDGINDHVNVGSNAILDNLQAFTYSAWINPTATGDREIFSKNNSARELRLMGGGNLRGCIIAMGGNACSDSVATVPLGTWTHVAMTYDHAGDKLVHLYIDGAEVGYAAQSTGGGGSMRNDAPWKQILGRRQNNSRPFAGMLDEMMIFDTALPECRIEALAEGPAE